MLLSAVRHFVTWLRSPLRVDLAVSDSHTYFGLMERSTVQTIDCYGIYSVDAADNPDVFNFMVQVSKHVIIVKLRDHRYWNRSYLWFFPFKRVTAHEEQSE